MHKLSWKLIGTFILLVVVSVSLMAFIISQSTTEEFRQYVTRCDAEYVQEVNMELEKFYAGGHTWTGVKEILVKELRSNNDRLVINDNTGKVIGDTAGEWLGRKAGDIGLYNAIPINYSGQKVGEFYLVSAAISNGTCNMEGRGCGTMTVMNVAEENYLNRVNNYLWLAGVFSTLVALFLGVLITRQIILPVRDLTRGADQVAKGNLSYRVKSSSRDELGELAQSFNSMASNLDKLEQSRKRLTADITHELRTPLTVIEGTVDAIMDGVFQPDKDHLVTIKDQTAQLTRLINDLRDISSAESGQMKLNLSPTDMVDLARRKIAQIEVQALNKGVQLKLNASGDIPAVKADHTRMEQVITNLLTNAIRHTLSGGSVIVSVQVMKESGTLNSAGKPRLVITVADTGNGIPADHLPHVFERFYRVESSRYKGQGETGLGLAIVKQMVQAHGGEVWAKSTEGTGSTFYVALPLD
jgi:signal transduction histidine kinase